ncbi:MAG: DNA-binding protein [Bacteroidetes bacterium GWF2_49_14]|nr:MAG: DNA-binding protein [Bacteroidetes bacterium GWF2_49_14]HBB90991.1 DNA-binding protein [Bacteroidales bacterium]
MSTKKSFVLRLNPEKFEALEKWAADEFRSTNGQLEWIISEALRKAGRLLKIKEEREKKKEGEELRDSN